MTTVSDGRVVKTKRVFFLLCYRARYAHAGTRTHGERKCCFSGFFFFSVLISWSILSETLYSFPSLPSHQHFLTFFAPADLLCVFFFRKKNTDKTKDARTTRERKTSGGQINHVATRVCHDAKTLFWRRSKRSASGKCVFNAEEFSFFIFSFPELFLCIRVSVKWRMNSVLMFLRAHLSLSFSLFFIFFIAKKCAGVHLEHEPNAL